eukprot:scaffold10978_cov22-Tisochrysis_lutea.AAC.1
MISEVQPTQRPEIVGGFCAGLKGLGQTRMSHDRASVQDNGVHPSLARLLLWTESRFLLASIRSTHQCCTCHAPPQDYPELYAKARESTRSSPAPNKTLISDWGDSLKQ